MKAEVQTGMRPDYEERIFIILERIGQIAQAETLRLRSGDIGSLAHFVEQKSRALLDMAKCSRAGGDVLSARSQQKALEIRGLLTSNCNALQAHMQALRHVSSILSGAFGEAESDGTYRLNRVEY